MKRHILSRRAVTIGLVASGLYASYTQARSAVQGELLDLRDLESSLGETARIGVAATDHATGATVIHRPDERFAMCSTFKLPLTAMILADAEAGALSLNDHVDYTSDDVVPWSPWTEQHVETGASIRQLCAAAMTLSDNAASNLLLAKIGGPAGFTRRLREWGDETTRLDRWEPKLNENLAGDLRDTTTPAAMAGLLGKLVFGDVLSPGSRTQLEIWMVETRTGLNRLRAATPDGWSAGDKTGTSLNGAVNDIAFFQSPGRSAIVVSCYINAPDADRDAATLAHQTIAGRALDSLTG